MNIRLADAIASFRSSRTRPSHQALDGQRRELDEPFSNGLQYPGDSSGSAAEVWNCRCTMVSYLPEYDSEDEPRLTYSEWVAYKKATGSTAKKITESQYAEAKALANNKHINRVKNIISDMAEEEGITYNQVYPLIKKLTEDEIIGKLAGGDQTGRSCASVALAYCGQKSGYDVLDFRGGKSMDFFAQKITKVKMWKECGIPFISESSFKSNLANGNKILKQVQAGKEYYLSVGRHASIIRRTNDRTLQYLELQSAKISGWTDFTENPRNTLRDRFGCTSSSAYINTA